MGIHDLEDLSLSVIKSSIWLLLSSITSAHLHFGLRLCQRNLVDWKEMLWQHEDLAGGSFSSSPETSRPYPGLSAVRLKTEVRAGWKLCHMAFQLKAALQIARAWKPEVSGVGNQAGKTSHSPFPLSPRALRYFCSSSNRRDRFPLDLLR